MHDIREAQDFVLNRVGTKYHQKKGGVQLIENNNIRLIIIEYLLT